MSNIFEAFEECLNSNRSCEEVYQRMNKISEFKLHPEINELKLIKLFLICIKTYFKEKKIMNQTITHFIQNYLNISLNLIYMKNIY